MCGYILAIILGFILACGITNAVTKKAKKPKGDDHDGKKKES